MMISVIVPVYNAGRWLGDAIASVEAQTWSDWELVAVDDGSTDGSGALCDGHAAHDPRIRVVHKSNGGLSSARNAGLDAARGEWVTFLDADDLLPRDALAVMAHAAARTGADIAVGRYREFEGEPPACGPADAAVEALTPREAVMRMLYQAPGTDNSACAKLFRADLFRRQRFTEGIGYEDLDAMPRFYLEARTVAVTDAVTYLYRQHSASYMHRFSARHADVLDVAGRLVDLLDGTDPALSRAARSRQLSAAFNIYGRIAADPDAAAYGALAARCEALVRRLRREFLFDGRVRPKNRLAVIASYAGGMPLIRLLSKFMYK